MNKTWIILGITALIGIALTLARASIQSADSYDIRYMIWDNRDGVIKDLVNEWNEKNPDCRVKLMAVPWDGYWEKLATMSAGKTLPDIYWLNTSNLYTFVDRGLVEDLTPYVERDFQSVDSFLRKFQPKLLVETWRFEGSLWGVDRDFDTIALFYNIDLFEKAGVDIPNGTWTWNDVRAAAEKLTKDLDGDGRIDQWGLYIPTWAQGGWLNLIWQNGGRVMNDDHTQLVIDSPEAIEALQWMKELTFGNKEKGIPRVAPQGGQGAVVGLDLFRQGRLAMTYDGSWMLREMARTKSIRWDVEVLPGRRMKDGSIRRAVVTNGLADCMWKDTPHPEKAWKFMKYLASMDFHRRMPVIPSRIGAEKSWIERNPVPANRQVVIDMLAYARPIPVTPENTLWMDRLMHTAISPVLVSGSRDPGPTLKDAVPKINRMLDEIYKRRERRKQ